MCPMDDRDRAEVRALCDLFRELMQREIDPPPFDQEARVRIGSGATGEIRLRGGERLKPRHSFRRADPIFCQGQPVRSQSRALRLDRLVDALLRLLLAFLQGRHHLA